MATTKFHTRKLVDELCSLPAQDKSMFDIDPQQIRDQLGKTLERFAGSDEHARRIVDWLLFDRTPEQRKYRPTPGEIREASEACPRDTQGQPPAFNRDCPDCHGDGVVIRWVLSWNVEENGEVVRKRRYVPDQENGLAEVAAMRPDRMASVCDAAVPCRCRRAA